MRFLDSATIVEGVADVDPVATPESIDRDHVMAFTKNRKMDPTALFLALMGTGAETVTVDLYLMVEDFGATETEPNKYIGASKRWLQFATGIVVTNGTLQTVTSGLPAGGVVYVRVTGETLGGGQTRQLLASWV